MIGLPALAFGAWLVVSQVRRRGRAAGRAPSGRV
jgi:hypothetical protein